MNPAEIDELVEKVLFLRQADLIWITQLAFYNISVTWFMININYYFVNLLPDVYCGDHEGLSWILRRYGHMVRIILWATALWLMTTKLCVYT